MNFGKYHIGQSVLEIKDDLLEFSKLEYSIIKPLFRDEKIYNAKDVNFLGNVWTSVLGVTQGRIYKISLQTSHYQNNLGEGLYNHIYKELTDEYSQCSESRKNSNSDIAIWDTIFGNIFLHNEKLFEDESVLIITITSNEPFNVVATENVLKAGSKGHVLLYVIGGVIILASLPNHFNFIWVGVFFIALGIIITKTKIL